MRSGRCEEDPPTSEVANGRSEDIVDPNIPLKQIWLFKFALRASPIQPQAILEVPIFKRMLQYTVAGNAPL